MGSSMAKHLADAGAELHIYTRTKAKAQAVIENGMKWHESPGELAWVCEVVITSVGYPKDVA